MRTETNINAFITTASLILLIVSTSLIFAQDPVVPNGTENRTNPTKQNSQNIAKGKEIFKAQCADCHGDPAVVKSAETELMAPDPASMEFQKKADGVMFNTISEGKNDMPAYKDEISEEGIWQIIDFMRSLKVQQNQNEAPSDTILMAEGSDSKPETTGSPEPNVNNENSSSSANEEGKMLFEKSCKACHTFGGGDKMGPDLKGVTAMYSSKWIKDFILSSKKLIKDGDKAAIVSFEKFKKKSMPDFKFSDKQLNDLLDYFSGQSEETGNSPDPLPQSAIQGDALKGKLYFEGSLRFSNKGVSCISCHDVNSGLKIPGGRLAANLTYSFKNSGGHDGLYSVLEAPPFPSMKASYENNPLSEEEMEHLLSFLETASNTPETAKPTKSGFFRNCSLGSALLLLFIMSIIWKKRKKYSVNKEILNRHKGSSIYTE